MSEHKLAGLTEAQWNTLCEIVDGKSHEINPKPRKMHDIREALIARNLITPVPEAVWDVVATGCGYSLAMDTRRKARDQ